MGLDAAYPKAHGRCQNRAGRLNGARIIRASRCANYAESVFDLLFIHLGLLSRACATLSSGVSVSSFYAYAR